MPPKFAFPENQRLWIPLARRRAQGRARSLRYSVRVRPARTRRDHSERALEDLTRSPGGSRAEYPATNEGWSAHARTLREAFLPDDVTLVL